MLRYATQRGVAVLSRPDRIRRVLTRLSCTLALRLANIPMPDTVVTESLSEAAAAVERMRQAVLKPMFSTKARGMVIVEAGAGARGALARFQAEGNRVMYIQQKVALPGHDLGLAFLGGEYLATYARLQRYGSWNTTTHFGGRYEPRQPPPEIVDLAHRAQALFGLDFTCVDVACTPDGPVVFEVSAFGGFRGLKEAHGIDAAVRLADHVIKAIEDG